MGGAGPIGSNLIEDLYKENNIFLFDKNIKNKKNKKINLIKGDCFNLNDLNKLPKKIDVIFFFIGAKGGPESVKVDSIKKYIKLNFESLVFFINFLKKKKIKKIIFSSTEHVYGDSDTSNKKCLDLEPFPKNYYGFSKLLSEKYLFDFYQKTGVSVDILRIPRVIYFNDESIISKIIIKFFKNQKIFLKKTKAKFNFIFMTDLIQAMKICLLQEKTDFRILNIFNNTAPISSLDMAKKIKNLIKKKNKISLIKNNSIEHNPFNLFISNKFTKHSLNWTPKFSLIKIIKKLIIHYEFKN